MKAITKILCVASIAFLLPSCFLFKGGGGHSKPCPAYGQENASQERESFTKQTFEVVTEERI